MMDPFVAVTLKFALIFGLPALAIGVFCHVILPRWPVVLLGLLVAVEIALFCADLVYENDGTGLQMVVVPGVLTGFFVANLLAIPVARTLRPSAKQ